MKLIQPTQNFLKSISGYFVKEHKKIRENIALCVYGMLRCECVNTAEIARSMTEVNGQSFKTNDMRVYRLLQSDNFQVSDRLWRGHSALLFDLLKESGLKKGMLVQINVDFTSDRNDFLILCAAIQWEGQSLPIYFSLRNYPKRKGMMDQKKMELAFFKALRHLLPKTYRYCIVADRGFGHARLVNILENLGFSYVLRLSDNFYLRDDAQEQPNKQMSNSLAHCNMDRKNIFVFAWKRKIRLIKKVKDEAHWLLVASDDISQPADLYQERFAIEKLFKNIKSGGFDLEKLLVNKYDRFKRMIFMACVAYSVMAMAGLFLSQKSHPIKENYSLHLSVLSAFSP